MDVWVAVTWRVLLALALLGVIVLSARARSPRRAVPRGDLRRLVLSALCLYVVGGVAWLTHHAILAILVYAAGIAVAALAGWLSRGEEDGGWGRDGEQPQDASPPPGPDGPWGAERPDWDAFEAQLRDYAARSRERAGVG